MALDFHASLPKGLRGDTACLEWTLAVAVSTVTGDALCALSQ